VVTFALPNNTGSCLESGNSSSERIEKKSNQENKKDFFGRMKKALIFALPIEKRETKKLLTSTVNNSRSA
jgi:hypothetical protein